MGNTYTWTATTGNGYYSLGFAIWIDLNNDGFYQTSEMLATSAPATTHAGTVFIPLSATPGVNRKMRIRSGYYQYITGGQACQSFLGGYGETEDYLVDIISPTPCSGIPASNTVIAPPNGICPGATASLSFATTYTTLNMSFLWGASTISNVGPFTAIPTATNQSYVTPPLNTNTYYQATVTCANSTGSIATTSGLVVIQNNLISQVPYLENFEGITKNNEWPNCSWTATSPTTVARTYTTTYSQQRSAYSGSKFASFYYNPSGTNYAFTNGIQLYAGVTYSAGLMFKTNYYGDLNWTDMSIMLGTSQSSTGLVSIASTNGPAASSSYKALSNTFNVQTSGIYYVAVKATSSGCCAYHLNWDDLSITAPCSLNTPTLSLTPNTATICAGGTVNIGVQGAHTYNWNTGDTGDLIFVSPPSSTSFMVTGTNTLTGCTASQSQYITVLPTPLVFVFANKTSVCSGSPVNLTAVGANTYTWSNLSNSQNITVNPVSTTGYSVQGMGSSGCTAMASQLITVLPLPTIVASSDHPDMCKGETATLSGTGGSTYQWLANTLYISAQQAIVSPNASTTYTLVGTDLNGCSNSTSIIQNVSECLGINGVTTVSGDVRIYPNPTAGILTVELRNSNSKSIEVIDITGRVVLANVTRDEFSTLNISALSNGVYYVKIKSEKTLEVVKVVKQ
jgi:hypothetical protein